MDDVGAAAKQNEIYGRTRVGVGPVHVPFPGNFLFFKYLPGIRKWGPYPEMSPALWLEFLELLRRSGARLTLGVTASWVERDGTLVPFPQKFPAQAEILRDAAREGLVEIANHGLTHCVLMEGRFRPKLFSGNRTEHREFWPWVPDEVQADHLKRSQAILQDWFGIPVVTLVPPGNVFHDATVRIAKELGIRIISCKTATRVEGGLAYVGDENLLPFHDREIVLEGTGWLTRQLERLDWSGVRFVREVGEALLAGAA
jgi:peptidoglycan/xylan/chitin deacetylase (PgdA/CDA1 family)